MFQKVINNILWLFLDKILRLGIGVFVFVAFARYLGPKDFGLYNYIGSLVVLFTAVSVLGMNAIITRDLITRNNTEELLGTAFSIKTISSIVAYLLLIASIFILREDDVFARNIAIVMGLSLPFQSREVVKYWFESQIQSRYIVLINNFIFIMFSIVKLIFIYSSLSLLSFAALVAFESFILFLGYFYIYLYTKNSFKDWFYSSTEARRLLLESWPLIVSSVAWVVYTKIDQVMIGQMIGDEAVGFYSSASKLSEVANFLPTIITFSVVPAILAIKEKNRKLYDIRFQQLYYFLTTMMVFMAIAVTFFSDSIIFLLYGEGYIESSKVLAIHFWIIVFTSLAVISGRYLINDGLQKFTMKRHLLGVAVNIPLNYIVIPIHGIEGAAVASLIALILSNYVFDFFSAKTRFIFYQKTKSLCFFWLIETIILVFNKSKHKL